jgi:hypothetical protein
MPDIKHMIQVNAAPPLVFPLVATASGFTNWWAADVTDDKAAGTVELGFFNRATVYGLRPIQITAPGKAHWRCETGQEWSGTRLLFDLQEQKGQTVLRFTHADWQAETDYFISCTTAWGELMFRIKAAAEGKNPGALFTKDGMGY